ncbi:predicted protein [Histoplasma capsulatum var. duboisii H88]|uniref:Predicted protein n=1 Tax=Ajellomyces capsulatus (strain H88) TaxID=544711 RepID=F0UBM2_AJEC8|nr:predicted protein [Histoplasma capsulatum var. duboisii H88]
MPVRKGKLPSRKRVWSLGHSHSRLEGMVFCQLAPQQKLAFPEAERGVEAARIRTSSWDFRGRPRIHIIDQPLIPGDLGHQPRRKNLKNPFCRTELSSYEERRSDYPGIFPELAFVGRQAWTFAGGIRGSRPATLKDVEIMVSYC